MAGRPHWVVRSGVGVATAVLLLAGLSTTALGGERPVRAVDTAAHRFDGPPPAGERSPASASTFSTASSSSAADAVATAAADAAGAATGAAAATAGRGLAADEASGDALPPTGAFTDSGEEGVRNIAALQDWLGGTEIRVAHTYLPGDSWADVEDAPGMLRPWADWTRAASGRMLVVNVPMQQRNEAHLSDDRVRTLIRAGADGANDAHFTRLARNLVDLGVPDTVIVLGWEMNGETYSHRCGPDPEGWKGYWNRIVAAMRSVPGQRFRFDFAPSRGRDAVPWTACYPGDASVDVIGMDSYDQPAGESFHEQVTEPYGLQAQVDFAARHHKAVSYPEWGLFRNGDDADYMSLMLAWIIEHKPLYQTITDYCPHGVWQCGENPRSSAVYRALLSGRRTAPAPSATPAPSPSPQSTGGSAADADRSCTPMQLSTAMKQTYDSGEVCVTLHRRAGAASGGASGSGTGSGSGSGTGSGTGSDSGAGSGTASDSGADPDSAAAVGGTAVARG